MHWVDIIEAYGADFYVICDNEELKYRLIDLYLSNGHDRPCKFIESYREALSPVVDGLNFTSKWLNIAYAMLTPFIHAQYNDYDYIWNIDADDTMFFAQPGKCAEILKATENCAIEDCIRVFSLDFGYSLFRVQRGVRWTFGVTFIQIRDMDYFGIIDKGKRINNNLGFKMFRFQLNIDDYFTFMRERGFLKAESFYCEGLYFEHVGQSVFTWKDGSIIFEFASKWTLRQISDKKQIPIAGDSYKIDIGLTASYAMTVSPQA
jgi:hypothetical protein